MFYHFKSNGFLDCMMLKSKVILHLILTGTGSALVKVVLIQESRKKFFQFLKMECMYMLVEKVSDVLDLRGNLMSLEELILMLLKILRRRGVQAIIIILVAGTLARLFKMAILMFCKEVFMKYNSFIPFLVA